MATFGKNILDSLTTGMYSDSKVIYREYIQNACDQIDKAVDLGIIKKEDASVDITINTQERYICIEDNATGVESDKFITDLGDIANSNKEIGRNKGFRGIGRLCGLAYCTTLKFTTSYKDEAVASIMTCDAKKMREMLYENKKYTVDEIWDSIVKYDYIGEKSDEHYFKVELIGINRENTVLLNCDEIKKYLSFVAPVPYKNTFYHFAERIYKYADNLGYRLDEYEIFVNGGQIFKEYTTRLKRQSGANLVNYDEISDLEFHEYRNDKGKLLAWSWIGLSRFEKSIPKENRMRGLRLRSANIQVGNDDVLKDFFKENRGNYYFVGEVFAIDKDLIPNSQRDYFNENEMRVAFEDAIREYFYDVLHKLYTEGNKINNAYKHQAAYIEKVNEYESKSKENGFTSEIERQKLEIEIEEAKKRAESDRKQLERYDALDKDSPIAIINRSIKRKYDADKLTEQAATTDIPVENQSKKSKPYIVQQFSKLSRNERKIISKILTIITDNAPKDIAEVIINKIKEEFK